MPCWAQGMQMRDGKALWRTPLWAPIHHKPQRMPASSWSLAPCAASAIGTQAHSWPLLMMTFFLCCHVALQQWHFNNGASTMALALKVGSRFLGAFSHHGAVPCIISKDWYLLPMPPTWCFLFNLAVWHALAKNSGQFHSPPRWLCFEYCEFKHLSHYHSNHSGAGMNVPADAQKRVRPELLQVPCGHPVPYLRRPAQMEMGQWLEEEKARAWFPCGRGRITTPNSSPMCRFKV